MYFVVVMFHTYHKYIIGIYKYMYSYTLIWKNLSYIDFIFFFQFPTFYIAFSILKVKLYETIYWEGTLLKCYSELL